MENFPKNPVPALPTLNTFRYRWDTSKGVPNLQKFADFCSGKGVGPAMVDYVEGEIWLTTLATPEVAGPLMGEFLTALAAEPPPPVLTPGQKFARLRERAIQGKLTGPEQSELLAMIAANIVMPNLPAEVIKNDPTPLDLEFRGNSMVAGT